MFSAYHFGFSLAFSTTLHLGLLTMILISTSSLQRKTENPKKSSEEPLTEQDTLALSRGPCDRTYTAQHLQELSSQHTQSCTNGPLIASLSNLSGGPSLLINGSSSELSPGSACNSATTTLRLARSVVEQDYKRHPQQRVGSAEQATAISGAAIRASAALPPTGQLFARLICT